MADTSADPYKTLIRRVRAQFKDPSASPEFEPDEVVEAIFEALSTLNLSVTTGFVVESDEIAGATFNPYSDVATVVVIGAAAQLAHYSAVKANRENVDIRKRSLALSLSKQVAMWVAIADELDKKFERVKKQYIYRQTTGERISYDTTTEVLMTTGSTLGGSE